MMKNKIRQKPALYTVTRFFDLMSSKRDLVAANYFMSLTPEQAIRSWMYCLSIPEAHSTLSGAGMNQPHLRKT